MFVRIISFAIVLGFAATLAQAEEDLAAQAYAILQARCAECHGLEKKRSGLRVDSREALLKGGESAEPALLAGNADDSLLIYLVESDDPKERMPSKADPLPAAEIALLRAWIEAGAAWPANAALPADAGPHWAFQPVVEPSIPSISSSEAVRNHIDRFLIAKMDEVGIEPAPEADKRTLIRRLYLELIGLPPTPEQITAFVNDARPDAYEQTAQRLILLPQYGERQARRWLDVARYADTNGYEKDRPRSIWAYRDWVIDAFNANMPYDQFIVEQVAGDLLPDATESQKVATGFHRNAMFNEEGGIDAAEDWYKRTVDRANTTATAFLGLTMACAQCHDHKYDPISHREYFAFAAFINDSGEATLPLRDEKIEAARMEALARITAEEDELMERAASDSGVIDTFDAWIADTRDKSAPWRVLQPIAMTAESSTTLELLHDLSVLATGDVPNDDVYTLEFALDPLQYVVQSRNTQLEPDEHLIWVTTDLDANGLREVFVTNPKDRNGRAGAIWWAFFERKNGFVFTDELTTFQEQFTVGELPESPGLGIYSYSPAAANYGAMVKVSVQGESVSEEGIRTIYPRAGHSTYPADFTPSDQFQTGTASVGDILAGKIEVPMLGGESSYDISAIRLEVLPHEGLPGGGPGRGEILADGDFLLTRVRAELVSASGVVPIEIASVTQDFSAQDNEAAKAIDDSADTGWSIKGATGKPHAAVFEFAKPIDTRGKILRVVLEQDFIHQHVIGRLRVSVASRASPVVASGVPADIENALLTEKDKEAVFRHYVTEVAPALETDRKKLGELRAAIPKLPTTLVMTPRRVPRATVLYHRGEFLQPREEVAPGVLAVLPPLPDGVKKDRLTLARWIANRENPLTARVAMNRLWQQVFGGGLVGTVEDFGARGDKPTHPELLEWLATMFMDSGWSYKTMHLVLVNSAAFRRSTTTTPEMLEKDPENLMLARGARPRLEAETIRDVALAASGLLNDRVGGPSVYPPQPVGVAEVAYDGSPWPTSTGADRYRRGLYTYMKRTTPYAAGVTFDAPTGEEICPRRERTTTPLQALTLLNDRVYLEAAQALAKRVMDHGDDTYERISYLYILVLARDPDAAEVARITEFLGATREALESDAARARQIAGPIGVFSAAPSPELAAWTAVCRAILNLDETITRG